MKQRMARSLKVLSMAILMLCSAFALAESLQIREGFVREVPAGESTSAAFMNIVNVGARPVAIVAATSNAAQTTELHIYRRADKALRMEVVRRLVIPAHGQVQLAPDTYHLMLINLKRSLRAGESVNVILLDEEGKAYSARLPVVKMLNAV
jgi:periplasmic copper chaperone A